jgi:hypothetical protein
VPTGSLRQASSSGWDWLRKVARLGKLPELSLKESARAFDKSREGGDKSTFTQWGVSSKEAKATSIYYEYVKEKER